MLFFGFLILVMNGQIVANSGRFWGDFWIVGGVVIFVLGLVLLMRERIQETDVLQIKMP